MNELTGGDIPLMIPRFNGKNRVACAFREVARSIARENNLCANVDAILFVVDDVSGTPFRSASDISKIPPIWHDVLLQLTLRKFDFVIKFFNVNLEFGGGSPKWFGGLIYHELRHIKKNQKTGELYLDKTHDVEDWAELAKFGDWENDPHAAALIPDFVAKNFIPKEIV